MSSPFITLTIITISSIILLHHLSIAFVSQSPYRCYFPIKYYIYYQQLFNIKYQGTFGMIEGGNKAKKSGKRVFFFNAPPQQDKMESEARLVPKNQSAMEDAKKKKLLIFDYSDIIATTTKHKLTDRTDSPKYSASDLPILFKAPTPQILASKEKQAPKYDSAQVLFSKFMKNSQTEQRNKTDQSQTMKEYKREGSRPKVSSSKEPIVKLEHQQDFIATFRYSPGGQQISPVSNKKEIIFQQKNSMAMEIPSSNQQSPSTSSPMKHNSNLFWQYNKSMFNQNNEQPVTQDQSNLSHNDWHQNPHVVGSQASQPLPMPMPAMNPWQGQTPSMNDIPQMEVINNSPMLPPHYPQVAHYPQYLQHPQYPQYLQYPQQPDSPIPQCSQPMRPRQQQFDECPQLQQQVHQLVSLIQEQCRLSKYEQQQLIQQSIQIHSNTQLQIQLSNKYKQLCDTLYAQVLLQQRAILQLQHNYQRLSGHIQQLQAQAQAQRQGCVQSCDGNAYTHTHTDTDTDRDKDRNILARVERLEKQIQALQKNRQSPTDMIRDEHEHTQAQAQAEEMTIELYYISQLLHRAQQLITLLYGSEHRD